MAFRRALAIRAAVAVLLTPLAGAQAWAQANALQEQCQPLMTLNEQAQKAGAAIEAAVKRRAPPQETCNLIKVYQANETKMIGFVEKNGVWCGVPPQVLQQMKASQENTAKARHNACSAAAAPRPSRAPTLSESLGSMRIPDASTTRTGRGGAFDTLTGNPIAR